MWLGQWAHEYPTRDDWNMTMLRWFDHYLKDAPADLGPHFAYFRDWVDYSGNAAPAYATSPTFPVGTTRTWRLSGADALAS